MKKTVFPSNKDILHSLLQPYHQESPLKPKLVKMNPELADSTDDGTSFEKGYTENKQILKNLVSTYMNNGIVKRRIDLIQKNSIILDEDTESEDFSPLKGYKTLK